MNCNKAASGLLLSLSVILILGFPQYGLADKTSDKEIKKYLEAPPDGKSVYNLSFWSDSTIIVASLGLTALAYSMSYPLVNQRCPCDRSELNLIDRQVVPNNNKSMDVAANYTVAAALIAPVVIDYLDIGFSKSFVEDMVVYLEVLSVNFGLVTFTKFASQRPYPYMYEKPEKARSTDPSDYMSFYSGHTSTTFAALSSAAVTMNLRHKSILWPWILTGVAGTSVALEMVLSGEHFTTDVLVGSLMGVTIGTVIPGIHAREQPWYNHIFVAQYQHTPEVVWVAEF